jgi:hypothetical protein
MPGKCTQRTCRKCGDDGDGDDSGGDGGGGAYLHLGLLCWDLHSPCHFPHKFIITAPFFAPFSSCMKNNPEKIARGDSWPDW